MSPTVGPWPKKENKKCKLASSQGTRKQFLTKTFKNKIGSPHSVRQKTTTTKTHQDKQIAGVRWLHSEALEALIAAAKPDEALQICILRGMQKEEGEEDQLRKNLAYFSRQGDFNGTSKNDLGLLGSPESWDTWKYQSIFWSTKKSVDGAYIMGNFGGTFLVACCTYSTIGHTRLA